MITHIARITLLVVVVLFASTHLCYAQTAEDDYLKYKFYDEDDTDNDWWLEAVEQAVEGIGSPATRTSTRGTSADYALSAVRFSRRGVGYDEERYRAGGLTIDYTTARMLARLGHRATTSVGISTRGLAGATAETHSYLESDDAAPFDGHYLRAELHGRTYLGGISYRGSYTPATEGVRLKEGWSFSHALRARTGRDAYVEGVFGSSVELAAEARYCDRRNKLTITAMLPWSERGLRQSSVAEAYDLVGNNLYNPAWGRQGDKIRSARVAHTLRPELLASWWRRLTATTDVTITTNLSFERGGYTSVAWYNARTPMPDNYHYLPSYFATDDKRREVTDAWQANDLRYTQIAWDDLYHTNALQPDGHARYAVEDRRTNTLRTALAAAFCSRIGSVEVDYGIELYYRTSREFKVMDDLLGATHIIDIDYYLVDDATMANSLQNNLQHPNRTILEGDRFGYDFRLARLDVSLYGSAHRRWASMSLDVGLRIGSERTSRRGYYEKELFAGSGSLGGSRSIKAHPYLFTAAWSYELSAHTFTFATMLRGESPTAEDLFLQTQYNNRTAGPAKLATTFAADATYRYRSPRLNIAATLFVATVANEQHVIHYYDDLAGLYTNGVISDGRRAHFGLDATADILWSQHLSSTFALTATRNRFTRDSNVALYDDTTNDLLSLSRAAMEGYNTGMPELALYGDIALRHSGWLARLGLSYWGARYVEPSFVRRTARVTSYAQSAEEAATLATQQRLRDAVSIDLALSKSLRIKEFATLNLQFEIRNLSGSSIPSHAREQNRIRRTVIQGRTHVAPFADRLTYAYPRTIGLSASLWF